MLDISTTAPEAMYAMYSDIQVTRYVKMACAVIIVYDHLITLGSEIEFIWREKWSKVKVIYLLNRYYTLAAVFIDSSVIYSNDINQTVFFPGSCAHYYYWATYTCLLLAMVSQVIFQLRIQALYSGKKCLLTLMVLCFLGTSLTSAWILWTHLRGIQFVQVPVPPRSMFCIPTEISNFYSVWIPLLSFEILLCALAIFDGYRRLHSSGPLMTRGQTLIGVLIRDSVVYFLVIAAVYLIALLFWLFAPPGLLQGPSGFPAAFSCILSSRAIINLREVAYRKQAVSFNTGAILVALKDQLVQVKVKPDVLVAEP